MCGICGVVISDKTLLQFHSNDKNFDVSTDINLIFKKNLSDAQLNFPFKSVDFPIGTRKKIQVKILETLFLGVHKLQHRGYDGCGIALQLKNEIKVYKATGMVIEAIETLLPIILKDIMEESQLRLESYLHGELSRIHNELSKTSSDDNPNMSQKQYNLRSSENSLDNNPNMSQYNLNSAHNELSQIHKDLSLQRSINESSMGISHVRYKTVGANDFTSTQPLLRNKRICLAHNGQIEAPENCQPDSEHILNLIEENLSKDSKDSEVNIDFNTKCDQIFNVINKLFNSIKGSYSCLVMIKNVGLVAFRDPKGIRPLIIGQTTNEDYIIASESVSHDKIMQHFLNEIHNENEIIGWNFIRDVEPGECIIISSNGKFCNMRNLTNNVNNFTPCIFEYIYLSDEKSVIDKLPVRKARQELGKLLGKHMKIAYNEIYNYTDVVIPIPESSCIAAMALAEELNKPYCNLLELNSERKKARSFILPTQKERIEAVVNKFIVPLNYDFKGQNILLVDDSIVRGTTLKYIIEEIRNKCKNYGKINVASVAPPIKHENIYGIDIPNTELLIAYQKTDQEVAKLLNVDVVIYQDLNKMLELFSHIGTTQYEHSMFIETLTK